MKLLQINKNLILFFLSSTQKKFARYEWVHFDESIE